MAEEKIPIMAVTLTEKAAQEVKRAIVDNKLSENETVLRLGVVGGGCSGFNYSFGFDKSIESHVQEAVGKTLPEDKPDSEWDWGGLAEFAAARLKVEVTPDELKELGREKVAETLVERGSAADKKHNSRYDCHGVTLIVDRKSALYLDGTTVDFYDGLEKRGFVFDNPNAVKSCGCGSSFQA